MSERKVINKYYPPDFDPTKIPRAKKPKNGQVTVRMMLPMSVRCNTCGEYLYKGKKFNSKKETIWGQEYLGIKVFRFYMRCTLCSAEFTLRTDPQNADYICENGVSRNFEPWREEEKMEEEAKKQKEIEEEADAMKRLENRTIESKVEMDILEGLDMIKSLNARNAKIDTIELLKEMREKEHVEKQQQEEEDEKELEYFKKNSKNYHPRGAEEEEEEDEEIIEEEVLDLEALKKEVAERERLHKLQLEAEKQNPSTTPSVKSSETPSSTAAPTDVLTSSTPAPAPSNPVIQPPKKTTPAVKFQVVKKVQPPKPQPVVVVKDDDDGPGLSLVDY